MKIIKQMNYNKVLLILGIGVILSSCNGGKTSSKENNSSNKEGNKKESKEKKIQKAQASLKELSDKEYPHNPNIGNRAKDYGQYDYKNVVLKKQKKEIYDIILVPENEKSDTMIIEGVNLRLYIPKIPKSLKKHEYLTHIGLINQEWNRQQVRYKKGKKLKFKTKGEDDGFKRVDVARNCLNTGLWEVIAYKKEKGGVKPGYHGWFDFPKDLFVQLFEKLNGLDYSKYKNHLEKWTEPKKKKLALNKLRKVVKDYGQRPFESFNDEFYPMTGARAEDKKYENIIYPEKPDQIKDLLTDSTKFANFDKPGFYNKDNPRKTKLGRLYELKSVQFRKTKPAWSKKDETYELELSFDGRKGQRKTDLIIGGLIKDRIPKLPVKKHNNGYKMSMGIANHPFYETYSESKKNEYTQNPYFAVLTDKNGVWRDSHKIGIDGPILHWDKKQKGLLHIYILSFERHAFVGHYTVHLPDKGVS
ncbi:MAG: hypothetical protein ABEH43_08415 [Flavobacteriales bacterium]